MTWTPPTPPVSNSPGQGSDLSPSLVDQTQQKVGQVVDQAQQTAGQVTEQAKQQATSQLETQKDRAVESLVTVGQALRQTSQHLHEQQQGGIASYMDQAAERVEGLTNHLRSRDVGQLLADTEDIARRSPVLFLGAAAVLGFAGARFLMSSGGRARAQRAYGAGSSSSGGRAYGAGYGSSPAFGAGYGSTPGYGSEPTHGGAPYGTSGPRSAYGAPGSSAQAPDVAPQPGRGVVGGTPRLPVV